MYPLSGFSLLGVPLVRPPVFLPFAISEVSLVFNFWCVGMS